MPDREAPVSLAQHSFAAGEVAPGFYGRQDLQKYGSGCAVLRNFYVDARGGATVRPGTQFIGHPTIGGYCVLVPWQFSPDVGQSYVLVFTDRTLIFVKNPGTPHYPNGSNAAFVETSGGATYSIVTPYLEADLLGLHYVQIADVMWITCRGYPRKKLTRLADNDWTLADISSLPSIAAPTMSSVTVSAAPSGVSPAPTITTRYMYCVSAIDTDGDESLPSIPMVSTPGINIGVTEGTVSLLWVGVADASYYKVWKALPAHGDKIPLMSEQFGFAGYAYGNSFTDSNITADFTKAPIRPNDPFAPGILKGYAISAPGSGYMPGETSIVVSDTTGFGAVVYPVLDSNSSGTAGGIVGLYIADPGRNYTAPTMTATGAGSGFAATGTIGPTSGLEPSAVGLFQQRLIYASTDNRPNAIIASRPGAPDDFRKTNPPVDNDSFDIEIFDTQVSRIYWLKSMPGGLLIGSNSGVMQLTGGNSNAGNPVAVSSSNAVIVPQTFSGSADIVPALIDKEVLYVQREGTVRDLTYNFYANIYAGNDLGVLSNHLFSANRVVDWAYAHSTNKIVWTFFVNGQFASLTYLKAQEVAGWARHDTQGVVESICTIQEGTVNAVYFSVWRNGQRCIERQAQQHLDRASDAWQLDCALGETFASPTSVISGLDHLEGLDVWAVVDGVASQPYRVIGGSITLTTAGTRVLVGLGYQAQLQPLYIESPGEGTIQGKRKKIAAASIRVHNTKGLKYGPDLANVTLWVEGTSSTDDNVYTPYRADGLYSGDQRIWLDQTFGIGGWVCIEQDAPYPATVLAIIPEIAQGEVM